MFIIYKENTPGSVVCRGRSLSSHAISENNPIISLTLDLLSWKPSQTHKKLKCDKGKKMKEKHENSSYESNQALTEGAELHTAISWTMTTMSKEGYNVLSFSMTPRPPHRAGTRFFNQLVPFAG